jgi:antitoxin MazE
VGKIKLPHMKVAFQKWGNSLALRVPKVVAQEIGASDGKTAEMSVLTANS